MKQNIISAGLLTAGLMIVLMGIYPLVMWCIAQAAPNQGKGFVITDSHQKKQYQNIGQSFTKEEYFWGRPSAVAYNASGSGASNKASNNEEYLKEVEKRLNEFLEKNPDVKRENVPVDLITASGSGLDPHISVRAALIQVKRISEIRRIEPEKLIQLINGHIEKPWMNLMGPEKINVVALNNALDKMNKK